jgi:hypothetical protein
MLEARVRVALETMTFRFMEISLNSFEGEGSGVHGLVVKGKSR